MLLQSCLQVHDVVDGFLNEYSSEVKSEGAVDAVTALAAKLDSIKSLAKNVKQLLVEVFLLKACVNFENGKTMKTMPGSDPAQASDLQSTALKVIRQQKAFLASNKLGLVEDDLHVGLFKCAQALLESGA